MARRIYLWTGSGAIATIVGLFAWLVFLGFSITADDVTYCNGNICESVIRITNPTGNDTDIYNKLQVQLEFTPKVKWNEFMVEDGSCKLKADGSLSKSSTGIPCGKAGWRWLNFTDETKPRKDRIYVWRFAKYSTKRYLLRGEKFSLFDQVKWGMAITGNHSIDPVWITANHYKGGIENSEGGAYFNVAGIANLSIDKYFARSGDRITFVFEPFILLKAKQATLSVESSKIDLVDVSAIAGSEFVNRTEIVMSFKNVTYANGTKESVPISILKNITVKIPVYASVPVRTFNYDGREWTGFEINPANIKNYSFRLKTKYLGQVVNYSFMLNSSEYFMEFHPVLDDGLVSYWDMSGVSNMTTDIFGTNDGALSGTTTVRATSAGVNGEYLSLAAGVLGTGGFFTVGDTTDQLYPFDSKNSWTYALSYWINTTDTSGRMVTHAITSSGVGSQCWAQNPLLIDMGTSSSLMYRGFTATRNHINFPGNLSDNKWHNVIMTSNATGGFLYIDGKSIGLMPLDTGGCVESSGWNLTFGCNSGADFPNTTQCAGAAPDMDMRIDEVALWSRGFNQSDASFLYYNGTNGTFCTGDPCSFVPAVEVGAEPLRPANITFPRANIATNYTAINFSGIGNFTLYIYRNNTFMQNVSSNTTMNLSYPEGEYLMNFSVSNGTHWYANQSINYTIDNISAKIDFVANTPTNNTGSTDDWIFVNITESDGTEMSALIDFDNSLVGYWRFEDAGDNRTSDVSSYQDNGTMMGFGCLEMDCNLTSIGGVASGFISAGKRGMAVSLDGIDDYVNGSNNTALNIVGNLTLEAWVKPAGGANGVFVGNYDHGTPARRKYLLGMYSNKPSIIISPDGSNSSERAGTTTLQNGRWYHVVGVYDSSVPSLLLYVNGVSEGALAGNPMPSSLLSSIVDVTIGRVSYNGGVSTIYNGSVDEVKIWNRALSAQEVNASFNAKINRLERNFTKLSLGKHNYTAYVVDSAGNLNKTEMRFYTIKEPVAITLYLDNLSQDRYYEYETTAILAANFSAIGKGNETICYNIDMAEYGNNYFCGNETTPLIFNITQLIENHFGNSTSNTTMLNRSDSGRFNATLDNRTIIVSFSFNVTGFTTDINGVTTDYNEVGSKGINLTANISSISGGIDEDTSTFANCDSHPGSSTKSCMLLENISVPYNATHLQFVFKRLATDTDDTTEGIRGLIPAVYALNYSSNLWTLMNGSYDNPGLIVANVITNLSVEDFAKGRHLQINVTMNRIGSDALCTGTCRNDKYYEGWVLYHFASYPENVSFRILNNRTEASLPGYLIGKDLYENRFLVGGQIKTIHNITYAQASSEKIFLNVSLVGVSQLEASIGSKNLTLNLSFNLSGFIVDANVSFRTIDNLSTNAYINFTSSYNATMNTTPTRSNLSAWDNFASNLTAAGINRWTYETLSGGGLILREYGWVTDFNSNSVEKNNITVMGRTGVYVDGSARYYENEFDIRNLSRIDVDWFQYTSCGTTSQSCSATTRVIVFDGTVQATLRDYTSSCGPCFTSVSYSADENISLRKVDDDTFDIYVNGVFHQTVNLDGLDESKPWRLGFYGSTSGTGGTEMDLHKISLNAIMAAKSGPWNNQYNKSLSVMSKPVDLVVDNITAASLSVVDLTVENLGQVNRTFELSNNNGKDWLIVSLNSRRVFDSLGSDIVWRINCTSADVRDTCIISKVVVMVNPGQVNNITVDYGDDGVADFFFSGILNETNSPIKVTNSSMPVWTHAKNNCLGALTCVVPIKITAGSEGIIQINNVNRTQIISNITLNRTLFETDNQLFWNATFTQGIVMLDGLKIRYLGSRNVSIYASYAGNGSLISNNSVVRMLRVIHSVFNETLPKLISQFEIIPKTVNDKNLTPYGQNSTRPFLNITANAYDLPLNYSIALNQTSPSCIAIRVANNSNFTNSAPLNTTRVWNKFSVAPKNTMGAWFQVDLNNCNASSLFNFNFDYKSMSLCDRCVHTIDKDN